MKSNLKTNRIIHLKDRLEYYLLVKKLPLKLHKMEIELKEYAINLLANSSCSDWNRTKNEGDLETISNQILLNCDDAVVVKLTEISLEIENLVSKIPDDNKL